MSDYSELHNLFKLAEEKIKTVEHLEIDGLTIPAINELRYAGKHCLVSLTSSDQTAISFSIHEAKDHCKRAIYDVMEMGIVVLLHNIEQFSKDYKRVRITKVIPKYIADRQNVINARTYISQNNRAEITSKGYQIIQSHFDQVRAITDKFELSRPELNKVMYNRFLTLVLAILAITVAAAGVIINVCSTP